ncbi:MAG: hypothetical protein GYB66_10455 [Chloroflexi bacterium]|nr:hypothetical protein [Chloroflexota bacterium]
MKHFQHLFQTIISLIALRVSANWLPPQLKALAASHASLRMVLTIPGLKPMFVFTYWDNASAIHSLPDDPYTLRDTIITAYIQARYEQASRKRFTPFSLEELEDALSCAALRDTLRGHGTRYRALPHEVPIPPVNSLELDDFTSSHDVDTKALIAQACRLEVIKKHGGGRWRFTYLILRDYYATRYAFANFDGDDRYSAVVIASKLNDPRMVKSLISCLNDNNDLIRHHAAAGLQHLEDAAVLSVIAALGSEHTMTRRYAIDVLEQLHDRRAVEPLTALLHDDDWGIRHTAARALKTFEVTSTPSVIEHSKKK